MTVPIGIIIFFCVYKLSEFINSLHIESSSARYFSFVGHSQLSRVEFQRHIFFGSSARVRDCLLVADLSAVFTF